MQSSKCNQCKKRSAVIYDRASGRVYCKRCYRYSLVKRVKRFISRERMFDVNDRIVFVFDPFAPSRSIACLDMLSIIERSFPSSIAVIAPPWIQLPKNLRLATTLIHDPRLTRALLEPLSVFDRDRALRFVGRGHAKLLGFNKVVLPSSADALSFNVLSCIAEGEPWRALEFIPKHDDVCRPFACLTEEELIAYSSLFFADFLSYEVHDEAAYKGLSGELKELLEELVASSHEYALNPWMLLEKLNVKPGLPKCPTCNGYVEEGKCWTCLYLESVS